MRKLSDKEREYAKQMIKNRAKTINIVMMVFKIWGGLQIFALLMYAFLGGAPKSDIPFMLVGCVILFLVYFVLTTCLANKNQWRVLLKAVETGKEYAHEGILVKTYETSNAGDSGPSEFKAVLLWGEKELNGGADKALEHAEPGSSVVMFSAYENPELGTRLVIAVMPD